MNLHQNEHEINEINERLIQIESYIMIEKLYQQHGTKPFKSKDVDVPSRTLSKYLDKQVFGLTLHKIGDGRNTQWQIKPTRLRAAIDSIETIYKNLTRGGAK